MPKRRDINKILIIGSGPIVIGQACEFDYSGTQACKALKSEGYKIVLINSNPATIMTDPEFSDATYIEPLVIETVERVIAKERPDALLPTVGGQTALNLAILSYEEGILDRYGVELIGANAEAIKRAEDRLLFKKAMEEIGVDLPKSSVVRSLEEAREAIRDIGFPAVIRPAFTLGGSGGNIVYNMEEFEDRVLVGLDTSPINEVLIEESVLGWKEFELEVMRDLNDNVVIICSIENLDPMGVHTGDSITVAPAQTLTDVEYQRMRDMAIKIIRKIGVDTGGSNIQFAVNPHTGRMVVIEMNPRVSRSSALASKATGFPIAKIAAKLAVGFTLDEIPNDITKKTLASFEPTLDYVVVKFPRWAFDKFKSADSTLTTQMKSVGETMAIGRTFKEALQKAIRGLEIGRMGIGSDRLALRSFSASEIKQHLQNPNENRIFFIYEALKSGISIDEIYELTKIDRWFLFQIKDIVDEERRLSEEIRQYKDIYDVPVDVISRFKKLGFSDRQIAIIKNKKLLDSMSIDSIKDYAKLDGVIRDEEKRIFRYRRERGIMPVYKVVDTCAGEFESYTPYFYSSYDEEDEANPLKRRKVVILGAGPTRIGQGIEFDYACVHAVWAARELGYYAIMVNSNPETVSTDYDTSDKLYFEPLTVEDVLHILYREEPDGVIVQFGGQTPLKIAKAISEEGFKILGTSPESIDIAEDRERFSSLVNELGLLQPQNGIAYSIEEAVIVADRIGYPVLVRPSYVLGGRAMAIVNNKEELLEYLKEAQEVSEEKPILVDKFLEQAIEIDVDALSDGEDIYIGGILQHIEQAGVHSGDSAMIIPPKDLSKNIIDEIVDTTLKLALRLKVKGLMNVQYAVKDNKLYIIEVNPRASRTVPFISKATGIPLAKYSTQIALGKSLKDFPNLKGRRLFNMKRFYAVKESVFPFNKFPEEDAILGPEMKSTGEVMGISRSSEVAFIKSQIASGISIPMEGKVFVSLNDKTKPMLYNEIRTLYNLGYSIIATYGTYNYLRERGLLNVELVRKASESRPNIIDIIKNREISMIINTPSGYSAHKDAGEIRKLAIRYNIPLFTTQEAAKALVKGILAIKNRAIDIVSLQEVYKIIG
jgi:carbamoyl-phosphate synthase large subunit